MLTPLLSSLTSLKQVGPTTANFLTKLLGRNRVFDLLLHQPLRVEKISFKPKLFDVQNNQLVAIQLKIESYLQPSNSRQPHKIIGYNPTGYVSLVFFKLFPGQLDKMKIGSEVIVLGYLQKNGGENQMVHPKEIVPVAMADKLPQFDVIYPLSGIITQKFLGLKIKECLAIALKNRPADEWIDQALLKNEGWNDFYQSLAILHNPMSEDDFSPKNPARKRLAYDELLAWQLAVLLAKNQSKKSKTYIQQDSNLVEKFLHTLPFKPTTAQLNAIKKISLEINSDKRMLRLLQGDVGSGKTIVAIASCLHNFLQKKQSCILAPTTVLAKQHFSYFKKLLQTFNLRIELLTSATSNKKKQEISEKLSQGEVDILISTHAVLEDKIKFQNLGLGIIDEQHRFGVMQRLKLVEKGQEVDILLMSATPIPRSLMMALYGDMDISILDEKPLNRQKITTLSVSDSRIDEVYQAINRAISSQEKVYWICPTIEESEELELASAKKKFSELSQKLDARILGLIHGKMKESEKEKVMAEFASSDNKTKLLISTTVIEVGIDVPDATIIVIENAENFGLSQLHQLRGRVGRSDKKSFCILLYGEKLGINGKKRLQILKESDDGFFIAEEDLKMRGSGEFLGTKQSGFPEFKIANLSLDNDLLKIAHKQAKMVLESDTKLQEASSKKYRELLQLFCYDECLRMVSSG